MSNDEQLIILRGEKMQMEINLLDDKVFLLTKNFCAKLRTLVKKDEKTNEFKIYPLKIEDIYPLSYLLNKDEANVLPRNTRFHYKLEDKEIFVIEEEPRIRNISVIMSHRRELEALKEQQKLDLFGVPKELQEDPSKMMMLRFRLAFPYVIYYIELARYEKKFISMAVFGSLTPFESFQDNFIRLPLPNIGFDAIACLGGDNVNIEKKNASETIDYLIKSFWEKQFNMDLIANYDEYLNNFHNKKYIRGFFSWSYYTKINPRFVFDENWSYYAENINISAFNSQGNLRRNNENYFDWLDHFHFVDDGENNDGPYQRIPAINSIKIGDIFLRKFHPIVIDEKEMFLCDVIYSNSKDGSTITKLVFHVYENNYDDNDKEIIMDYNSETTSKIYNALTRGNRTAKVFLNGVEIEEQKIYEILFHDGKKTAAFIAGINDYSKVLGIEIFEFILNNNMTYLSTAIKEIKEIDTTLTATDGSKIEVGDVVIVISNSMNYCGLMELIKAKYIGLTVGSGSTVLINFEIEKHNEMTFKFNSLSEETIKIFTVDNFNQRFRAVPIFHDCGRILVSRKENALVYMDTSEDGISFVFNNLDKGPFISLVDSIGDCSNLTEIDIPGMFSDLEWKVGEKYIIPDWDNPDTVFDLKEVLRFEIENNTLICIVKNLTTLQEEKIEIIQSNNIILNCSWKPIEYGNFKPEKIYRFKNTNVVGFTSKTKKKLKAIVEVMNRPLGLFCDNTTLFLDEVEYSEVKINSENFTMEKVTVPFKVGDMLKFKLDGKDELAFVESSYNGGKEYYVDNFTKYFRQRKTYSSFYFADYSIKDVKRFGIPLPQSKVGGSYKKIRVIPSIHGGFRSYEATGSGYDVSEIYMTKAQQKNMIF